MIIESASAFHKRRIASILSTLEEEEKSVVLDYHRRKLKGLIEAENNPVLLGYCPIHGLYIKDKDIPCG